MTTTAAPSTRHEAPEIAAAARRMMRSLVRRAAAGDTEALVELDNLIGFAQVATNAAGHMMQRDGLYSFTDLAGELNTTRQAAAKRFGRAPVRSALMDWLVS